MRMILLAIGTLVLAAAADTRPSEARPWYPWCAQYADRSGITQCAFVTFGQCLATVRGIGGACVQNWYAPPVVPRYERPRRRYYY
jgi:hypothetical protein